MVDLQLSDSPEEADREGLLRLQKLDPLAKVGSVHHTVPKFYLRRFAKNDQVNVRVPGESNVRRDNIANLGVRDFYTVIVDADGLAHMQSAMKLPSDELVATWREGSGPKAPDGRLEDILGVMEARAAEVIGRIIAAPQTPVDQNERFALATFLGFQMARGIRARREIELMGEFYAKTMLRSGPRPKVQRRADVAAARRAGKTPARGNGSGRQRRNAGRRKLSDAQLADLTIRPEPNQHILMLADMADRFAVHLFVRPYTLVELDQPLLVTGDEPVVVIGDEEIKHLQTCLLTEKERRRRLERAVLAGREFREHLHLYTTRPQDVDKANMVAIPLDPSRAIVLGLKNTGAPAFVKLTGSRAVAMADDLNGRLAAQAFAWMIAHPGNDAFLTMDLPAPGPLIKICDVESPIAASLNRAPEPRRPIRLRKTDWQ